MNKVEPDLIIYAGLGCAVLGPNVRGSSGYGDGLLRGLMGEVVGGEYDDLMSGVDFVIEAGYVDPERMGVAGWSWGGVSADWVVTRTNRFKAASPPVPARRGGSDEQNQPEHGLLRRPAGARRADPLHQVPEAGARDP